MSRKRRKSLPGATPFEPFKRGRGLPGQSGGDSGRDPSGLTIKISERPAVTLIVDELIRIGDPSTGNYVEIGLGAIKLFQDGQVKVALEIDGDLFLGQDTGLPADTYLAIMANDQTYNNESLGAGDMLVGDNSAGQANLLWDKSAGELQVRVGADVALYLDADGVKLAAGSQDINKLKMADGADVVGEVYAATDPGVDGRLSLVGRGKDGSTEEGAVEMVAITEDGQAHAGAAAVSVELATVNNQIALSAEKVKAAQFLIPGTMTTTVRDGLTAVTGAIIFNTTAGKLQGYDGTSWVDLH
jgi:hypothetical protein